MILEHAAILFAHAAGLIISKAHTKKDGTILEDMMTRDNDEHEFEKAMRNIYRSALSECGYRPTRFLQLVESHGAVAAAKQLLRSPVSEGLTKLWEFGRLDLSMEALVLTERWSKLFSDDDCRIARKRLNDLDYEQSG